jgi:hypothetical protein
MRQVDDLVIDEVNHKPLCPCGHVVLFWSGLLEQGFCSEECYLKVKTLQVDFVLDRGLETT